MLRAFFAERQLAAAAAAAAPPSAAAARKAASEDAESAAAAPLGAADSAAFLKHVCAALSLPVQEGMLRVAAEEAVLREDVDDLAAVLALAQSAWLKGKSVRTAPRWLLRIAGELPRLRRAAAAKAAAAAAGPASAGKLLPLAGVGMEPAAIAAAAARSVASRLA